VVLLLVTRGYADMLTNFLCSARALHIRHFLILTYDAEIIALAEQFNVSYYTPVSIADEDVNSPKDADFGTIRYQELIFSRTELTFELLLSGYQPIIADVDAVWLSDPLKYLPWITPGTDDTTMYDIAITDDNGEVCGCFVALRASDGAIRFWERVYLEHKALVQAVTTSGNIRALEDSEQKILTRLIYKNEYGKALYAWRLPDDVFPSGYAYFNVQAHLLSTKRPAVVHNNFIVGRNLKRARFQRYGMWSTLNATAVEANVAEICTSGNALSDYFRLFASASRNTTLPSLNLYLPVHNSVIPTDTLLLVSAEGPTTITHRDDGTTSFSFPQVRLAVTNNPPSYFEGSPILIAELALSDARKNTILPHTVTTLSEEVSASVDVGYDRDVFAMDRDQRYVVEANEEVLRAVRVAKVAHLASTTSDTTTDTNTLNQSISAANNRATMTYTIRVITYNRPDSLRRLLQSLASAEYQGRGDISLHIAVDHARAVEVCIMLACV